MKQYSDGFNHLLQEAYELANAAHAGQHRGDGVTPYVFHAIDVSKMVEKHWPTSHHAIIAGLLHDVVEDTAVTIEEVELKFGWRIAGIVAQLTSPPGLHGEARYQHQLDSITQLSFDSLIVKWADKMSNLHDIIHSPPRWKEEKIEANKARLKLHIKALSDEIHARVGTEMPA